MNYRLLGVCAAALCCAVPAFAQGLSRVELIGLQQQLRDDGCGVTHITARMDAMTRSSVKKCESKYSGATDAKSMLAAMHIGFENGNQTPTLATARSGNAGGMSGSMSGSMGGSMHDSTARPMHSGMGRMMKDSPGRQMMRQGGMRDSSMKMRRGDTSGARGSGGMMDMNKATPMSPMANPRNSSTMGTDSSTMKHDTMPKRDTMPKPL